MTDELDDLKQAMRTATPDPDPATRATHLALAEKNFVGIQESRDGARHTSSRPQRGLLKGVTAMLNALTSRAALTATTAVVAFGFVVLTYSDTQPRRFGLYPETTSGRTEAGPETGIVAATEERDNAFADDRARQPAAAPQQEREAIARLAPSPEPAQTLAEASGNGLDGAAAAQPTAKTRALGGTISEDALLTDPALQPLDTDRETYANAAPNPLRITAEEPVSTFSIDVDTASYALIRNSLMNGGLPDPQAVRIEEMVNYFPYDYPAPDGGAFRSTVSVSETPWNPDTRLVHIGIQGALPDVGMRPPLNLVFLIDTSGSMNQPDKLPLLKQSFRLMLGQLRPTDQVAIVTYAGSAGQVLAPTDAADRATILAALDRLQAGGSTAGQAGLQQAYATAAAMAAEGEVSRVILATDGDFNVGLSDPAALEDYIADKRDGGTYLSVLGFGRGNLQDATMQALAQNGNGQAAYIDTLSEAQKVLVDQLTGALFPIANDVKIQVEFNPAEIAEYRLIGYETRALRREDFNNDAVDAGDIGAGHTVTALYEVTPVGSPARLSDPLRYQVQAGGEANGELGYLRLRYKAPGEAMSQLIETPITADMAPLPDAGFATAIAGFGQLLRGSDYVTGWSFGDAIALANRTRGDDPYGYRAEAIQLMRLAASLSQE